MLSKMIQSMRRRVGPVGLSLLAAALTAVAFAAVSVAKDDSNKGGEGATFEQRVGPPGPPPELSDEDKAAMEEFRACMEENGAPAPPEPGSIEQGDRPEPPSEADRAKIEKALEACKDKLPEGAQMHFGPGGPCGPPPGAPGAPPEDSDGAAAPAPTPQGQSS